MQNYKVITYIGSEYANEYLANILKHKLNQIGLYQNCVSTVEVISRWTNLPDSDPLIGIPGKNSLEKEIRIELTVAEECLKNVLHILKDNHPYEEPEINIYPMYNYKDLL